MPETAEPEYFSVARGGMGKQRLHCISDACEREMQKISAYGKHLISDNPDCGESVKAFNDQGFNDQQKTDWRNLAICRNTESCLPNAS
jgi:hypothetical protein